MKDRLLQYYEENVREYVLIYSHAKWHFRFILFWLILLFIGLINTFFSLGFILIFPKWVTYSFILMFISSILSPVLFNIMKKKGRLILNEEFGIKASSKNWDILIRDIQVNKISEYLIEHELYSKSKIEKIIDMYNTDNGKDKLPPLFTPAVIVAITVPNLNQFIGYLYNLNDGKNLYGVIDWQVYIFGIILLITLALIFLISRFVSLKELIQESMLKRNERRKNLISILDDILLLVKE